jgi:hypothetical protein
MPTVSEEVVSGFAFCADPRCPGYEQVEAAVRVTTTEWLYVELGGDLPGFERSMSYETFALSEDEPWPTCRHCGERMEVATQQRPEYARISGQDPLRLLSLDQDTIRRAMQADQSQQAVELANMRAELAELKAEMMGMVLAARGSALPSDPGSPAGVAAPAGDDSAPPVPARGRPKGTKS